MITICLVCPRCDRENTNAGFHRFIGSAAPLALHLKTVPCLDCLAVQKWAQDFLRARGEWLDAEPELPPRPRPPVRFTQDDFFPGSEWR